MASCMEGHSGRRPYKMFCRERILLLPVSPFMFHFICHVPQTDGCCEAQSTTFNSSINQASPHVMNYWLSVLRGNSLFYFSPWQTWLFINSSLGPCCITECLFPACKREYKFTGTSGVGVSHYYMDCYCDFFFLVVEPKKWSGIAYETAKYNKTKTNKKIGLVQNKQ